MIDADEATVIFGSPAGGVVRVMPVMLPFPSESCLTIAVMDSDGNVTIRTEVPKGDDDDEGH